MASAGLGRRGVSSSLARRRRRRLPEPAGPREAKLEGGAAAAGSGRASGRCEAGSERGSARSQVGGHGASSGPPANATQRRRGQTEDSGLDAQRSCHAEPGTLSLSPHRVGKSEVENGHRRSAAAPSPSRSEAHAAARTGVRGGEGGQSSSPSAD